MKHPNQVLKHPATPALEDSGALTAFCKATADALRLKILRILRLDSLGVLEMSRILAVRQSALSHHLKILANAGLVSTRREGNAIFYRRVFLEAGDPLGPLKSVFFDTVDRIRLEPGLARRLLEIKQERDRQSLDFFGRFAGKFKQTQLLVAGTGQYSGSLGDLLRGLQLPAHATVLEVGPGEGELLPLLAKDFSRVIALDNSEEMLERSRRFVAERNIHNVEFVLGDTAIAVKKKFKVNLIVVSMVLHHVSSPADIFSDAYRLLENGGVMLIVDLCRHNQDWVRESCGDLWQGFEPEELNNWGAQAGFQGGQSLYLGLRNGFQIQMRLFHKPQDGQPLVPLPGDGVLARPRHSTETRLK